MITITCDSCGAEIAREGVVRSAVQVRGHDFRRTFHFCPGPCENAARRILADGAANGKLGPLVLQKRFT